MYRCKYCKNGKVTHCLVTGSLDRGYKELPVCRKCAKKINEGYPHKFDLESIVDFIDLMDPSSNLLWVRELFN